MKNALLDAVTKSKTAYVTAKTTLEARLRERLKEELSNLQTQVDIAVRIAYNSGESKADIMRAMGTKDYHTLNAALARTEAVEEIRGDDPLGNVYALDGDVLTVDYLKHGVGELTGKARFTVKRLADGEIMLDPIDSLWNDDYTIKNQVVAVLGGRFEGEYYEEAIEWLTNTSAQ